MPLDIVVVMDPIASVNTKKDSTFAMLLEGQRRSHRMHFAGPGALGVIDGRAAVRAAPIQVRDRSERWFELGKAHWRSFAEFDVALMRRDPPVDPDYIHDTQIL
jgi:glutathione synthase